MQLFAKLSGYNTQSNSVSYLSHIAKIFIVISLAILNTLPFAHSQITPESLFSDSPTFLKVDEAFAFDYEQKGNQLVVKWDIAEGYYLYKKQFKTVSKGVTLGQPEFPEHEQIEDEFFGLSDVFFQDIALNYPIVQANQDGSVKLRYQGCAKAGLCYPPTTKVVYLDAFNSAPDNTEQSNNEASSDSNSSLVNKEKIANDSSIDSNSAVSSQFTLADQLLSGQSIVIKLGLLALLGLGLAFTPCVYPMYPILSSIVIGKGKEQIKTSHAFMLSFVYVQGMAITYSILGLIVASAGVQFQAALQHPVLLSIFILLFVALAAAMFGLYEIQMPAKWQNKLNNLSNGQKQGNYVGVFIMGVVSGLVASPCTTAPLTAVLIVVAQSDSLLFGFSALYALSLGMGIPLILFGITGGKLLPKAGAWMNVVKVTFGFMMLTVAILFLERFVISPWTDLLWAALGLALFTYWYTMNQNTQTSFAKGIRTLIAVTGLIVSVIFTIQSLQNLKLIPNLLGSTPNTYAEHGEKQAANQHPTFMIVRDLADFEQKLAQANSKGQSVMLDLYADWCVACKEFEKYTFPAPQVVDALSDTVWMQIDLTDNTPSNLEFQEEFAVIGLPTIMFFDLSGNELARSRVTGFMKAEAFATHARKTLPKN